MTNHSAVTESLVAELVRIREGLKAMAAAINRMKTEFSFNAHLNDLLQGLYARAIEYALTIVAAERNFADYLANAAVRVFELAYQAEERDLYKLSQYFRKEADALQTEGRLINGTLGF
jgi:hypothetical protein